MINALHFLMWGHHHQLHRKHVMQTSPSEHIPPCVQNRTETGDREWGPWIVGINELVGVKPQTAVEK